LLPPSRQPPTGQRNEKIDFARAVWKGAATTFDLNFYFLLEMKGKMRKNLRRTGTMSIIGSMRWQRGAPRY
jgi:hypothetical protein